jgi:predicted metal-binding membrane protein
VLDGVAVASRQRGWREHFMWRHPEWWAMGLSALAWLLLVVLPAGSGHASHALPSATALWLLMVVAMMVPLVLEPIRATAARSLWRRRHRAIGGFLLGYVGPWLIVGGVISVVEVALGVTERLDPTAGAALGFAVAAVWQLAPRKWQALQACHRTAPLAPRGWRADRDCVRYGWSIGRSCVVSCWALMLACVLAGHSLPAMMVAATVATADRYLVRPEQPLIFSVLFGIALVCGVLAVSLG